MAVKLVEHLGSRLRDPTDIVLQLPVDSIVELEGPVDEYTGLVTAICNAEAFSIVFDDLRGNAEQVAATSE